MGVSSIDLTTPTRIAVNPVTGALLIDGASLELSLDGRYVKLTGDTMTGDLTTPNIFTETITGTDAASFYLKAANGANGAFIEVDGGNATITDGAGGDVYFVGGSNTALTPGNASGGSLFFQAGFPYGTGVAGHVELDAANNNEGDGGYVQINGGYGVQGDGGDIIFAAGFATGNGKIGGDVLLASGAGTGGATNGKIRLNSQSSGDAILDTTNIILTAKTFQFPNKSGTIALTGDIDSTYLRLDTANGPLTGDLNILTGVTSTFRIKSTTGASAFFSMAGDSEFDISIYDGSNVNTNGLNINVDGENEYISGQTATLGSNLNARHVFYISQHEVVRIDQCGYLGIGTDTPLGILDVRSNNIAIKGINVKQTATITKTITNVALTSAVATITTTTNHTYAVGQFVTITGLTNTTLNGSWVIASIPTLTTFTFAHNVVDIVSVGDSGTTSVAQTGNLLDIQNSSGSSLLTINGNGQLATTAGTGSFLRSSYFGLLGEGIGDYSMTGMYDRNELTNAGLRGTISVTITGAGTFSASTVNNLVSAVPGNFFTISSVDTTTSKVVIVVDLGSNQSNYASAQWQPFLQYRILLGSPINASYMRNVVAEASTDNITYFSPSSGVWATTDIQANSIVPTCWFGGAGSPGTPGNVYRYVRFTLTDLYYNPAYSFRGNIWIAQLGLRHAGAPFARQYASTTGADFYGAIRQLRSGSSTLTNMLLNNDGSAQFRNIVQAYQYYGNGNSLDIPKRDDQPIRTISTLQPINPQPGDIWVDIG